jgi:hypothetical protein
MGTLLAGSTAAADAEARRTASPTHCNRCTNPILKVGSAVRRGDALALSLRPAVR